MKKGLKDWVNLTVGIILENSIDAIALLFVFSKLKYSIVILDKEISNNQLKKYNSNINLDLIITNDNNLKKFKNFGNKLLNLSNINLFTKKIKPKKKINFIFVLFPLVQLEYQSQ